MTSSVDRVRRHTHLVRAMLATDLRARMQYRGDFAVWIVLGVLFQLAALVFVVVVVTHFNGIGGWTIEEVTLIVGIRLTAHAIYEMIFGNIGRIGSMVRDGWFDRLLVRPASPLVQVVGTSFQVNGFGDLVVGLVALASALSAIRIDQPALASVQVVVVVSGSVSLEAGLHLVLASTSFWFIRTDSLMWWIDDFSNTFSNYPVTVFPLIARFLLTWVFPLALLGFFPATTLMNRTRDVPFTPLLAWGAPIIGAVSFLGARVIWRAGINHHRSTGT
jgi:viologen exporter family transport system permease protein